MRWKSRTGHFLKGPEFGAQIGGNAIHDVESQIGVHTKFG